MDYIFLRTAKIISSIKKNGPIGIELIQSNDIALNFINNMVDLLQNANTPEYIKFMSEYEFNRILHNNKLDDINLKKMCIVKEIMPMIVNVDEDEFLTFAKYFCNEINYDAINIILNVMSESSMVSIIESDKYTQETKDRINEIHRIVHE